MGDDSWVSAVANVFLGLRDAGWPAHVVRAAIFECVHAVSRKQVAVPLRALQVTWRPAAPNPRRGAGLNWTASVCGLPCAPMKLVFWPQNKKPTTFVPKWSVSV
eukprot:3883072-Pyramimonas_sp.AAC.1